MKNYTTVIFDLTGVLFNVDKISMCKHIGLLNSFWYSLSQQKNPVHLYLETLDELYHRNPHTGQTLQHDNYHFPACVSAYYLGLATSGETICELEAGIDTLRKEHFFVNDCAYRLVKRISNLAYGSQEHTPYHKPIKPMLEVARILYKNGIKLHLLSNLDSETYDFLVAHHESFFDLFEGKTISAQVHMLKPYKDIYEHVLSTYGIAPSQTLFIDDQPENVATASACGMTAHQFSSPENTKRALRNLGLLG